MSSMPAQLHFAVDVDRARRFSWRLIDGASAILLSRDGFQTREGAVRHLREALPLFAAVEISGALEAFGEFES